MADIDKLNIAGTTYDIKAAKAVNDAQYSTPIYLYNFYRTKRDFTNGTNVITDLDGASNSCPFCLEVKGNGYGGGTVNFMCVGYVYNITQGSYNSYINIRGSNNGGTSCPPIVKAYCNTNGYLCFWWPRIEYWQGFDIFVSQNAEGQNGFNIKNHVTSVTDITFPSDARYTTNIYPRRYKISDLSIKYTNQSCSFSSIAGHYYIVGTNVLHGTSETPQKTLSGGTLILQNSSILRSGASSGLLQDSILSVVKATGTTVSINMRSNQANTQYECISWIDMGEYPQSIEKWTIGQAQGTYYVSSPSYGHYYLLFDTCLHNPSEYSNITLPVYHGLKFLEQDAVSTGAASSNLVTNGNMSIVLCCGKPFGVRARNINSDAPTYQNTHWIDLGEHFLWL